MMKTCLSILFCICVVICKSQIAQDGSFDSDHYGDIRGVSYIPNAATLLDDLSLIAASGANSVHIRMPEYDDILLNGLVANKLMLIVEISTIDFEAPNEITHYANKFKGYSNLLFWEIIDMGHKNSQVSSHHNAIETDKIAEIIHANDQHHPIALQTTAEQFSESINNIHVTMFSVLLNDDSKTSKAYTSIAAKSKKPLYFKIDYRHLLESSAENVHKNLMNHWNDFLKVRPNCSGITFGPWSNQSKLFVSDSKVPTSSYLVLKKAFQFKFSKNNAEQSQNAASPFTLKDIQTENFPALVPRDPQPSNNEQQGSYYTK